ncbi:MAG: DUF6672 family protein [Fusobacteriaceae bacterium]
MKKIINISLVFIFFLCVAIYLFIDGKQHKIFLENLSIELVEAPKEIIVILDDNNKEIKIKSKKRAVGFVKGRNHKIEISYVMNGEKKIKEGKFKTPLGKIVTLKLTSLISEEENWTKEEIIKE